MIDKKFLTARIERLTQLIAGFTREVTRMRSGDRRATDPVVPVELLAYATHIEDAARYLTHAREALARAQAALRRSNSAKSR
jgi:hypothetical protein